MAPDARTSLQVAAVQKAQDGCRRGRVGGQVVGVAQGVILKLREEKRGVNVRVAVVNLRVVGLGAARRPERGHGVGTGVFAQGSQRRGVGSQVRTTYTDAKRPLGADHGRCPAHGREQERMGYRVGKRGVDVVCRGEVGVGVRGVVLGVGGRVGDGVARGGSRRRCRVEDNRR